MGTYRTDRSYRWNYEHGPQLRGGAWPLAPNTPWKTFCGLPVRSRVGISAGLLLNSQWIDAYARLGYDLLTYKTVRTSYRPCYPLPNWVYLDARAPIEPDGDAPIYRARRRPRSPAGWTSAVCFGMPSMAPDVWREDVSRARELLSPAQVLIVSVVGTPDGRGEVRQLADDFALAARWAAGAGAHVVEANFSCPNVDSAEGSLYQDPDACRVVAKELRASLGATPLLIKLGHFAERHWLEATLRAIAPHADGAVLVNAISRRVLDRDGSPVFGTAHERVGVLGTGILPACVTNVRTAVEVSRAARLNLSVCAVGGIVRPDDPGAYFEAGADAVFMGGAPMMAPGLAAAIKARHPNW